ncbi:dioxygenase [Actinomadura sp. 3N508]|uniref:dioxygenase family protein n=1 Tax=Actinomadura sp. 3N508 TaxID=3375153 RepID=UPI0037BD3950
MPEDEQEQLESGISRKKFIVAAGIGALAVPTAVTAVTSATASAGTTAPRRLPLTPKCTDGDDEPTPAQTEGPYFTPGSPERTDIRQGKQGTLLTVTGIVYSQDCKPVNRALLDFWQCDAAGVYDNVGYVLRGHLFSGADGRYSLTTIVPGLYPGRTKHIHVKVQAPNARILTTQMYFPNEPRNNTDTIFDRRLLMTMSQGPTGMTGTLDFVVRV